MENTLAITFEGTAYIKDVDPNEYDEGLMAAVVQKFFDKHGLQLDVVGGEFINEVEG